MDTHTVEQPSLESGQFHPWVAQFMEGFFAALRSRNIGHCMLRNYQDFPVPRSATSDMDVMVDGDRWAEVLETLRRVVESMGLRVLISFTSTTVTPLNVHIAGTDGPALHLDLLTGLVWRQYDLIDPRLLLASVIVEPAPPRPRPAHEAAISLLGYLFHRGLVKPEYRSRISQLVAKDRSAFEYFISRVWGDAQAGALAELVSSADWDGVRLWKTRAIANLRRRGWGDAPLQTLSRLAGRLTNTLSRLARPPGLWIAVIGSDGSGKSTVSAALARSLSSVFAPDKSHQLHWRPGLLPSPRFIFSKSASASRSVPTTQPHALPPNSAAISILRFLYFWVDFALGANLLFRPRLGRNGLIVVDRYFYDFYVDQRRYRLTLPNWLVSCAAKLIPHPDLVFYLDGSPETILRRKTELPAAELTRQRAAFLALVGKLGQRGRVVNIDRTVGEIVIDLRRQVFDYLATREQRRGILRAGRAACRYPLSLVVGPVTDERARDGTAYVVLPSRRKFRWMLPARNSRLAVGALDVYAPAKLSGKVYKWLLGVWLRTWIGPQLLNRVSVDPAAESDLLRKVRALIPTGAQAHVAVSLGTPGPRQKLILAMMGPQGRPIAYAKIAHVPHACTALRTEKILLVALEQHTALAGQVPRSLGIFSSGGYLVHVQSPGFGHHSQAKLTVSHWRFLEELANGRRCNLHRYLSTLHFSDERVQDDLLRLGPEKTSLLRDSHAKAFGASDEDVTGCIAHGDFAPWNMRNHSDDAGRQQLFVYDWECGREDGLPLLDAFHFVVQSAILVDAFDGAHIWSKVKKMLADDACRVYRDKLAISDATAGKLFRLYLLQVILDSVESGEVMDSPLQTRRFAVLRAFEA